MASYLYESLPTPVVGTFGQTVSLSSILTQEFGPNYGGYTDFYVSYFGWQTLQHWSTQLSYWTATTQTYGTINAGTTTQWLQNGKDIGPADFNQTPDGNHWPVHIPVPDDPTTGVVHVTASNINQFSLQIGSNIAPFAFISVPVAFDSANNPTEFVQYTVATADPSLYSPTSAPTPSDVVAAAEAYAAKYQNVDSVADCSFIAQDVAAAAGAPLNDSTGSTDPSANVSAGFWRVVYRGSDPNPVSNWSMKVEAGDIVRVGWANGGAHMFTVVQVGATTSDGAHKDLTVYDNGVPDNQAIPGVASSIVGLHHDFVDGKYYDQWSDPTQVTIYRLSPDHEYLINGPDLALGSELGVRLVGTANNDHIIGGNGDDTISSWTGNDLIDGGGGVNNRLDYSWDTNPITADLWAGTTSKGGGWTDQFSNIQVFIGGSGSDVFYGKPGTFSFDGGGGAGIDTLDYSSHKNAFNVTVDLAQHTVTKQISGYTQTDSFSHMRSFVGTPYDDAFKSTFSGSYSFDGGDGPNNKLDYSSFQTGVTVNLQQASGTVEKGGVYVSQKDTFSNIQNFIGGSGSDTFKVATDSLDYTFDGGGGRGTDTLDYSAFTQGVTFDLQHDIVDKGIFIIPQGSDGDGLPKNKLIHAYDYFSNIETFKGGLKDDKLIDGFGTAKHFFDGGDGNDTVILSGNFKDYDFSASGKESDQLWHTVVNPTGTKENPLDLVHVEQLQFKDGSILTLADHGKSFSSGAAGAVVPGDFNSNGMHDYIWRDANADMTTWEYAATTQQVAQIDLGTVDFSWNILANDHFSNASTTEMLTQNVVDGTMTLWWVNNGQQLTGVDIGQHWNGIDYIANGPFADFGGAGISNFLVTNTGDHHLYDWWIDSNFKLQGIDLGAAWSNISFVGTGEFTPNGKTDFLVSNTIDHHLYDWWIDPASGTLQGLDLGAAWNNVGYIASGKFTENGGGNDNLLVFNQTDHHLYDWWIDPTSQTLQGVDLGAHWSNVEFVTSGHFDNHTTNDQMLVRNTVDNHLYEWWIDPTSHALTGIDLGAHPGIEFIDRGHFNNANGSTTNDQLLVHNTADGHLYEWWISNNQLSGADLII